MTKKHTPLVQLSAGGLNPRLASSLYSTHNSDFWYDTGNLSLNLALHNLGRGVRGGNAVELAGEPATAKTLTSLKLIASAQQQGGLGVFIDIEGRLDFDFVKSLGVDLERMYYFGPTKEAKVDKVLQRVSLTHDEVFTIISKVFQEMGQEENKDAPFVVVLDSLGALNSNRDLGLVKVSANAYKQEDNGKPKNDQGMRAKAIRGWVNNIGPHVQTSNGLLVILNHLFSNTDGHNKQPETRGGRAPKYLASVRIFFTKTSGSVMRDSKDEPVGELITATIAKSSIGVPYKSASIMVMFRPEGGVWLDYFSGTKSHLLREGLIEQNGSWYNVVGTDLKYQGELSLYEALNQGVIQFKEGRLVVSGPTT